VGLKVKDGVLEHDKPNDGDEDTGNIGAGVMLFCWLSPPRSCKSSLLGLKKKVKKTNTQFRNTILTDQHKCEYYSHSNCLGSVWMSILEGMVLNWVQYQINHGIEMDHDSNSVVWMTIEVAFGILESSQIGFVFGCTETWYWHLLLPPHRGPAREEAAPARKRAATRKRKRGPRPARKEDWRRGLRHQRGWRRRGRGRRGRRRRGARPARKEEGAAPPVRMEGEGAAPPSRKEEGPQRRGPRRRRGRGGGGRAAGEEGGGGRATGEDGGGGGRAAGKEGGGGGRAADEEGGGAAAGKEGGGGRRSRRGEQSEVRGGASRGDGGGRNGGDRGGHATQYRGVGVGIVGESGTEHHLALKEVSNTNSNNIQIADI
jgi:uncharacterized membrane protein YgcG